MSPQEFDAVIEIDGTWYGHNLGEPVTYTSKEPLKKKEPPST